MTQVDSPGTLVRMKDHLVAKMSCPGCGAGLDGALNTETDRGPRDGDPTLCVECRSMLVYSGTPVNSLRYPTSEEQREFLANPHMQRVIAAMRIVHEQRGSSA